MKALFPLTCALLIAPSSWAIDHTKILDGMVLGRRTGNYRTNSSNHAVLDDCYIEPEQVTRCTDVDFHGGGCYTKPTKLDPLTIKKIEKFSEEHHIGHSRLSKEMGSFLEQQLPTKAIHDMVEYTLGRGVRWGGDDGSPRVIGSIDQDGAFTSTPGLTQEELIFWVSLINNLCDH